MDSGDTWRAVALDEVESIDWRRMGITWRPIRRALGTDIVGMAAFTAQRPGEIVIEPHAEIDDGRGHQEVYVVIHGKARFVIDGTELDAPAGTFVRVDAPAHRQATAIEAGTAVLALGGECTFQAGASEWIERARPHIRTNPSRAREVLEDLAQARPGDRANDVGVALLAVGQGDESKARAIVARLVAEVPQIREVLAHDPDLRDLLPA